MVVTNDAKKTIQHALITHIINPYFNKHAVDSGLALLEIFDVVNEQYKNK